MNFNDPEFKPTGTANNLAVILHAYWSTRDNMAGVTKAVSESYEKDGGVDIYAPTLPYSRWYDPTGAKQIVLKLVSDLDEIWSKHKYDRIIFIGHSLGGLLARRVFLAGTPNPPDYDGGYLGRDDLPGEVTGAPRPWARQVKRILEDRHHARALRASYTVLLASAVRSHTVRIRIRRFVMWAPLVHVGPWWTARGVLSARTRRPARKISEAAYFSAGG